MNAHFIPAIGALCLGLVFGVIAGYSLRRFEAFNAKVLSLVFSALIGGAVAAYFGVEPLARWFYPIGLLGGLPLRPRKDSYILIGIFAVMAMLALVTLFFQHS